ncbi:MFS transporter [Leucobacter tenebrionis]|uniref:MFS transporter n=1 Tax=Leucobacter tenebrionis TaxID=2873270 RepID=UPI001CA735A3|nr:MFS transporter [Leucobacter tenebrionis]QZY50994.1 MHS family MFS transporter [Leucobacter tenebrionis]
MTTPSSDPALDHSPTVSSTTNSDGTQISMTTKDMRRVIASSFMGSMIEFYDFILYATAASIVFGKVFFSNLPPGFDVLASFATFAVGYLARPLGGIVFGHFGDKYGRKNVLILSMLMMGIASIVMGLLPSTATIGIAAPVILVLLRIVQGVSVGGEWGGAVLIALEHAPKKSRGLAAGLANAGGPVGAVLATLMLGLFSNLPEDQFLAWGWRVPFLLSVVLLVVGLVIRLRVAETPMFQKLEEEGAKKRAPIVDVLRHHWRTVLVALVAVLAFTATQGLMTVWGVSESVAAGADPTGVLNWKAVGAVTTVVIAIFAARLSDRLGRRTVIIAGCALGVVLAFPIISLLQTGTVWGFAVAIILGNGFVQGIVYGPMAAFVAEQFPTQLRFTGASAAYQTASTLGAGFSPIIATSLVIGMSATWPVAVFWIAVLVLAALAVLITPEGKDRKIH